MPKLDFKYPILLLCLSLISCTTNLKQSPKEPILEVLGEFLYQDDLEKIIPKDANMVDSANIADRYIQKWITTVLMYNSAKKNISNTNKIDKLVEDYRHSLIIHEYEQGIVSHRVDTNVTQEELQGFYDNFNLQFIADEHLISGMLLVTPIQTPQIEKVRDWIKKGNNESIEKIEKYSLKNAVSFDYFMEDWKTFSEISEKIPLKLEDSRSFLSQNRFVEISDSTKTYFLKISKVIYAGEIEPYQKAKDRISSIILNNKKNNFIINFEKSIYKDALKNGDVKFYKK